MLRGRPSNVSNAVHDMSPPALAATTGVGMVSAANDAGEPGTRLPERSFWKTAVNCANFVATGARWRHLGPTVLATSNHPKRVQILSTPSARTTVLCGRRGRSALIPSSIPNSGYSTLS